MQNKQTLLKNAVFLLFSFACVGVMLWVNTKLYGGVLLPDSAMLLLLAVVVPVCGLWDLEAPAGRKRTVQKVFLAACVLVVAFWSVWMLAHTRFSLEAWMYVTVLVWAGLFRLPPLRAWSAKKRSAAALYAALLAVMLVFLAAVKPVSLGQAGQIMRDSGYTDFELFTTQHWNPSNASDSLRDGEMGWYWFHAHQQGRVRLIEVSVLTGAVYDVGAED